MPQSDIEHFVRLAKRGSVTGCSGGEYQARQLALAIIKYAPGLDDSAINGAMEFLKRCPNAPTAAQELIGHER